MSSGTSWPRPGWKGASWGWERGCPTDEEAIPGSRDRPPTRGVRASQSLAQPSAPGRERPPGRPVLTWAVQPLRALRRPPRARVRGSAACCGALPWSGQRQLCAASPPASLRRARRRRWAAAEGEGRGQERPARVSRRPGSRRPAPAMRAPALPAVARSDSPPQAR